MRLAILAASSTAMLLALSMTVAGDYPTSPAYDQAEPYCRAMAEALRENGAMGDAPDNEPSPGEYDDMEHHEHCRDLRDGLQHKAYNGLNLPSVNECHRFNGMNTCILVNSWGCDVGVSAVFGAVYTCMGGLYPYN